MSAPENIEDKVKFPWEFLYRSYGNFFMRGLAFVFMLSMAFVGLRNEQIFGLGGKVGQYLLNHQSEIETSVLLVFLTSLFYLIGVLVTHLKCPEEIKEYKCLTIFKEKYSDHIKDHFLPDKEKKLEQSIRRKIEIPEKYSELASNVDAIVDAYKGASNDLFAPNTTEYLESEWKKHNREPATPRKVASVSLVATTLTFIIFLTWTASWAFGDSNVAT